MKIPFGLLIGALLALATTVAWSGLADDYPSKPIKVISNSTVEECVGSDEEGIESLGRKSGKGRIDLADP